MIFMPTFTCQSIRDLKNEAVMMKLKSTWRGRANHLVMQEIKVFRGILREELASAAIFLATVQNAWTSSYDDLGRLITGSMKPILSLDLLAVNKRLSSGLVWQCLNEIPQLRRIGYLKTVTIPICLKCFQCGSLSILVFPSWPRDLYVQ